jgi:hypothetical protein
MFLTGMHTIWASEVMLQTLARLVLQLASRDLAGAVSGVDLFVTFRTVIACFVF